MMSTIIIFAGAILLLALVYQMASRTETEGGMGEEYRFDGSRSRGWKLPSRMLVEHLFSRLDADFIGRHSLAIQKKYQRERKRITILWLRELRKAVGQTVHEYRMAVRTKEDVSAATEIKIAISYGSFQLLWMVACGLIWLQGPAAAQALASRAYDAAEGLFQVAGQLLQAEDAETVPKMKPAL